MVKNPSTSPSQNYYLGPLSESVHEMDGLSPKSWSVVHMDRWTDGRSADGRLRPRRLGLRWTAYLLVIFSKQFQASPCPTFIQKIGTHVGQQEQS